ncbi:MAG: hypothetical protein J7M18_08285 [Candidatus Eremiobacteraeota bacterium]|nr:hypothetical protein [Candidatus Eremiobacteraeota bacterium]
MKNKIFLVLLLFIMTGIIFTFAAGPKIILYGKPLNLKTIEKNGILYVPLVEFCDELNIPCIEKDGIYNIGEQEEENFGPPSYKYILKIANSLGEFKARVIINGKIVDDYTGDTEIEVTKFIHKGENKIIIQYENTGEVGGYDITIDEKVGEKIETKINFSMVWTQESQGNGEKEFTLSAP